jgi:potassium-transporting ATPase KdpC subunit
VIDVNRLPSLVRQHIAALRALLIFTVLCGIVYPVVMVGVAQVAFKHQADGSLVTYNGKVVGSSLICQEFVDAKGNPLPRYFQPRPSAASAPSGGSPTSPGTSKYGCDPQYSGGTNLGTNSTQLVKNIQGYKTAYEQMYHVPAAQVPPDAVTTSTSGLDPYISPQNAAIQAVEVASARHLPAATVLDLVKKYTQGRNLGFLGEPRVNVLNLNIALDELPGQ